MSYYLDLCHIPALSSHISPYLPQHQSSVTNQCLGSHTKTPISEDHIDPFDRPVDLTLMASTIDSILDNFAAKLEAKLDAILAACGIEQDPKQASPPEPITPPEPIIPLQPVIAVEQPVEPLLEPVIPLQPVITSEQPVTPPSIEKEEEISTSTSSEDLCKLQTRCQSPANLVLAFFVFCTEHVAPSLQFGSPLAYTRYAEDMEATGQG